MTMQVTLTNVSLEGLELAVYQLLNNINLDSLEHLDALDKVKAVANLLIATGNAMDKLIMVHEDNFEG